MNSTKLPRGVRSVVTFDGRPAEFDRYGICTSHDFHLEVFEPGRIGNTEPWDWEEDPGRRDPRPLAPLDVKDYPRVGQWLSVAGFETWRGSDGSIYVDVLGVADDGDAAFDLGDKPGAPFVIDRETVHRLRWAGWPTRGLQLVYRMYGPSGRSGT